VLVAVVAALLGTAPEAESAITFISTDDADEGFNDTSPRDPIGGNLATTLGEQRLNVFLRAAEIMSSVFPSPVEIVVEGSFDPLTCTPTSATLGSAGAADFLRNFPGTPRANTWFPAALADYFAGEEQLPGASDIVTRFNSAIGTTCAFPNVFYYGLDGNPPGAQFDLLTVVLHELAHGLGFATIVTLATGAKGQGTGFDDAFMLFLEDHETGLHYPDMTNAERVDASKAGGDLHWTGARVITDSFAVLSGRDQESGHVFMFAPDPQQPGSSVSHFDTIVSPNELMEPSYTGPNHDLGLAEALLQDIGWNSIATTSTGPPTTTTTVPATTTTSTTTTTSLPDVSTTTTSATVPETTSTTAATTTTTLPSSTTSLPATSSTTPPTTSTLQATTTTTVAAATTTTLVPTTTLPPTTTSVPATTSTTALPETTTTTREPTTTTAPASTTTTLEAVTCGDASGDDSITASDALAALRTAVGSATCAVCICDVNQSGAVNASDALAVLKHAVGSGVSLACPTC
jgi:hypothetical protein